MSDLTKKLHGVYRGTVAKNNDPNKQGRIQIYLPHQTEPTDWAWPMVPAGQGFYVPEIGQGVWVKFEKDDPEFPLWIGEFGKHKAKAKRILIKPLLDSVSLTGLTSYIIIVDKSDGTKEVDLTATFTAIAKKLKDHETRIVSLESQLTTLHSTLASRTAPSHTHGSNG
jgi:uncharacterized protein involved in type VI secretion and phage assembly